LGGKRTSDGRPPHFLQSTFNHNISLAFRGSHPTSTKRFRDQGTLASGGGAAGHDRPMSLESMEATSMVWRAVAPFDADKAREYRADWAKYLGVPIEITNSIGMKFLLIPPGDFEMGSSEELCLPCR
jgi:hypothetical protein